MHLLRGRRSSRFLKISQTQSPALSPSIQGYCISLDFHDARGTRLSSTCGINCNAISLPVLSIIPMGSSPPYMYAAIINSRQNGNWSGSDTEIAEKLHLSLSTVESHRKNVRHKLMAKNSAETVRIAMERGLFVSGRLETRP